MLMFCGFDLELTVERVITRRDGPALCSARDFTGGNWLIVQIDDEPTHLAWLCAPVSPRAMQAVINRPAAAWDAVRHSATGTVELVVVDHGRAVPERCLLCTTLSDHLLPLAHVPVACAA